jgi:rapamycin-insensitive companion of mTOR
MMALQIDEKTFQTMLADSQVMQSKDDHTKWNYDILIQLFDGPLLTTKPKFEEAFRTTKFGKRLMSFWHPSSRKFSELRNNKVCKSTLTLIISQVFQANLRWVRLGCLILNTLIKSADGIRFLASEDDLLKELSECFAQFDPVCPISIDMTVTYLVVIVEWQSSIRLHFHKTEGGGNVIIGIPSDARPVE